jgi:RimJ/RimL family protein N-acetyltransferase
MSFSSGLLDSATRRREEQMMVTNGEGPAQQQPSTVSVSRPNGSFMRITTERLVLTPLVMSDAADLFSYRSHPDVCRYQTWAPRSLDDARSFIEGLQSIVFDTAGTWFQFGIRLRDSDLLVGDIGAHFPSNEPHQVEIGVTVAPHHQGLGLATEAVLGLLDHVFGPLGKHRVFASVDPRNLPSMRLLARVGMRQEAHFRKSMWFKGKWVDDVVFALLESEWSGR